MINVLIIDGTESRKNGLAALIEGTPGYHCVGTFSDANGIVKHIEEYVPDIILMSNLGLEKIDTQDISDIRKLLPDLNIIVLSEEDNTELQLGILRAGVCGLLSAKIPPAQLLDSIKVVAEQGAQIDSFVSKKLLNYMQQQNSTQKENQSLLTPREIEVTVALTEGKKYKEIAESMFISINTVRYHIQNIYRKLHVHTEAAAVAKAIRQGFI
jgi:DNA-binding NarL/FixJ family response regulator